MAKDKNGNELKVGDIVTVVVKYRIVKVYEESVLAEKVYDVPSNVLEKLELQVPKEHRWYSKSILE